MAFSYEQHNQICVMEVEEEFAFSSEQYNQFFVEVELGVNSGWYILIHR